MCGCATGKKRQESARGRGGGGGGGSVVQAICHSQQTPETQVGAESFLLNAMTAIDEPHGHWFKQKFIQDEINIIQKIIMCSSTSYSL